VDTGQLSSVKDCLISIAGVGTVGNNILEALARKGFENFRFADSDALEIHNLNRIHAGFTDIGRKKTELAARNAFYINPYVRQERIDEGVHEDNVRQFVQGSKIVVAALDDVKMVYLIHKAACEFGIPVMMCADLHCKALFELFPYHDHRHRVPLNGRIKEAEVQRLATARSAREREVIYAKLMAALVNPRQLDAAMLRVLMARLRGEIHYWPQMNEAAKLSGVIAARAIYGLLTGEKVVEQAAIDLNRVLHGRIASLRETLYERPRAMIATMQMLRRQGQAGGDLPGRAASDNAEPQV
jgi:molybdopterin/thiamine biosynthesis adenylyltransferase